MTAVVKTDVGQLNGGAPTPYQPGAETAATAAAAREKAAVEARYIVAMNRPRDIDTFRTRLLQACRRPGFAEVAEYAKPVGGGKVKGPSIRFVEEALRHFGNVDTPSSVILDDDEKRILRISVTDLETNTSFSSDVILAKTVERKKPKPGDEVLRVRTNTQGEAVSIIRATEDDFLNKQNAAVSKLIRNNGLRLLPSDIVEEAMDQVHKTVQTRDAEDPAAARKRIVDAFFGLGVMPAQLAELLGHPLEAVTAAELTLLRTIFTALRDGETQWAEVVDTFGDKQKAAAKEARAQAKGTAGLKDQLKARQEKGAEKPAEAETTATESGDADEANLRLDQELAEKDGDL
ncbi:MAG: hypothetical protein IPK12_23355 [Gemmatimonadetes bacterium]|nr:hypothetical protein [Gemmatimonadota bacterium]